jgi:hypothetical protein
VCRLIFWTRNQTKTPHGYQRGDLIDILNDDQHCGIEVDGRDWFRAVLVPGAPRQRFEGLLYQEPWRLGTRAHKRARAINLDALEAIGRKAKRAQLDALDQIIIKSPAVIDGLTFVKAREPDRFHLR